MRVLFFFLLLFVVNCPTSAQTKIQLSEKSVVKDSSGTVYPYAIWQALLSKGYTIKTVDPKNPDTEFLLVKLTDQQIEDRIKKAPKPRESPYFTVGEKLSLFKTTDLNKNKIDLRDSTGKIIVLNFWFVDCPPCKREIPELNELVESFKNNKDVLFYAVALDDRSRLKDFLKTMPFHYNIIDDGKFIASKYSIKSYPTHVIIDKEGKVYFHTVGLAVNTVHWLKKSIEEILK